MITECTRFCVTMPHKMERRLKKMKLYTSIFFKQRSLIMGANDVADGRKTGKKYKKRLGVL